MASSPPLTAEEAAFGRTVRTHPTRTPADIARNLSDFLDVALGGGAWDTELGYAKRYEPLVFRREIFDAQHRPLLQEVSRAYRDPTVLISADRLNRFFNLTMKQADEALPSVGNNNDTPPRSWFYPRSRHGYWSSSARRADTGYGAPMDWRDGEQRPRTPAAAPRILSEVPPNHRRLFRDIVRMLRVFDVDHRLTRDAVKNLIRELEYENGRARPSAT